MNGAFHTLFQVTIHLLLLHSVSVHKRQRRWGNVKSKCSYDYFQKFSSILVLLMHFLATVCGNGVITLANGRIICA